MTRFSRMLKGSDSPPAADPPEAVNVESDFVVILAALLCALICVVGLIAVVRCAWLRRSESSASRSPSQAKVNKGLKKKILQSLPKFTYGDVSASGSCKFASTECAICLGEFGEKDEIRILPQCGHGFHVGCIDPWLGSQSSCPSCRQILGVARCQKCGRFPPSISSSSGEGAAEADSKSRVDNCDVSNNNNYHSHNLGGGFLP